MNTPGDRLKNARELRGYGTAKEAALAMGVPVTTYCQHESNSRGIPSKRAARYADFFGATPEFLLYGRPAEAPPPLAAIRVPLVGYIGAGSQAFFFAQRGPASRVDPPPGATSATRAVEVRAEDGLGAGFDRWLAFYEKGEGPITESHLGQLCLVALPDNRVLVKKVQQSRAPGLFHLTSGVAEPILDQEIVWAARITCMKPR